MVRTDHEDGGTLSPDSDQPDGDRPDNGEQSGRAEPTNGDRSATAKRAVRRTSPLARRGRSDGAKKKAAESGRTGAGEAAADDAAEFEAVGPDKPAVADEAPTEKSDDGRSADASDAAKEVDDGSADDRDRTISYRERRRAVDKPRRTAAVSDGVDVAKALAWGAAAAVVVASLVLAVVFGVQAYRIDDERALRAEYDQFAQDVIVKMTTLTPENADKMLELALNRTSGRAKQMFRENMKQVTDIIRDDKMETKTTILASAVTEATDEDGSVLIVYGWEARAPENPNEPDIATFRARVDVTRINGELKMTNLEWVA